MKTHWLWGCALAALCAALAPAHAAAEAAAKGLKPFANDAEFVALIAKWKSKAERRASTMAKAAPAPTPAPPASMAPPMPAKAAQMAAADAAGPGTAAAITNVQTQGVDEGDIVKQHGDYLVVLRRGRLFTIRVGADALEPVSALNAYAPDADPAGTWYDEMLIADRSVVVIGYSYARGGTEIGVFDLDDGGHLAYRATYQMRSNDYYSSRNYASRLIGHKLIFYTPLYLNPYADDPFATFPALRRWQAGATPADFHRILPATRVYRSAGDADFDFGATLHSVSVCDLEQPAMACRSSAVLGPPGRVFYVSNDAVYVWTTAWTHKPANNAAVFRIPLDGSVPGGLRASGSPIDQMSLLESDGWLNVLLGDGLGEGMWLAENGTQRVALLRVKLSEFGDGTPIVPRSGYRLLSDGGPAWSLQNRFIGDWLVYGSQSSNTAHALRYAAFGAIADLPVGHGVERIDALGRDAIVIGEHGRDLHFTGVALDAEAQVAGTYVQADAAQGDARTHGFFYRPDAAASGVLGLPIVRAGDSAAAVLYLHNRGLELSKLGSLESSNGAVADDACKASCVDWYGNARPIFLGRRIFALLGYELVEGRLDAETIRERRRTNFAPSAKVALAR